MFVSTSQAERARAASWMRCLGTRDTCVMKRIFIFWASKIVFFFSVCALAENIVIGALRLFFFSLHRLTRCSAFRDLPQRVLYDANMIAGFRSRSSGKVRSRKVLRRFALPFHGLRPTLLNMSSGGGALASGHTRAGDECSFSITPMCAHWLRCVELVGGTGRPKVTHHHKKPIGGGFLRSSSIVAPIFALVLTDAEERFVCGSEFFSCFPDSGR